MIIDQAALDAEVAAELAKVGLTPEGAALLPAEGEEVESVLSSAAHTADAEADTSGDEVIEETASPDADETPAEDNETETEAENADDASETPDETSETEDDPFADVLTDVPTAEMVEAQLAKSRIPTEWKERVTEYTSKWRDSVEKLASIGGETGIATAKPIIDVLSQPAPDEDARAQALATLLDNNFPVALELFADASGFLLADHRNNPQFPDDAKSAAWAYGNRLAENLFGVGLDTLHAYANLHAKYGQSLTPEKVDQFLQLEQGGYVDLESEMGLFRDAYPDSDLFERQRDKIAELERDLAAMKANPSAFASQQANAAAGVDPAMAEKALDAYDTSLKTRVDEAFNVIRERAGWSEGSTLAKLVNDAVWASLKNEPEYRALVKGLAQNAGLLDSGSFAVNATTLALSKKAQARFAEAARGISADLRAQTGNTRNAQLKAKAANAGGAPEPKPLGKPVNGQNGMTSLSTSDADIDALWNEFQATAYGGG